MSYCDLNGREKRYTIIDSRCSVCNTLTKDKEFKNHHYHYVYTNNCRVRILLSCIVTIMFGVLSYFLLEDSILRDLAFSVMLISLYTMLIVAFISIWRN